MSPENTSIESEQNPARLGWFDRTVFALALAALLVLGMGSLQSEPEGIYPKKYWAEKIDWKHCADVVLTGDSRVFMGVSPAEMQKTFPERRILNYGFAANGYSRKYLEATEGVLDPASATRTVIMGISPHSLTRDALERNNFDLTRQQSPRDKFMHLRFAGLENFFEPMSFKSAWRKLFPKKRSKVRYMKYHADGWVAGDRKPIKKFEKEVASYRRMYEKAPVSDAIVTGLLEAVRRYRQNGIRVYGFRPPTCAQMVEMENAESGFRQDQFVKEFTAAGGVWIDVPQTDWPSHDGSHLRMDGALDFTRELSRRIYVIEGGGMPEIRCACKQAG